MTLKWTQGKGLREVTGIRQTARIQNTQFGVFRERHPISGMYWSVRRRPLDNHGQPLYSWGLPLMFPSMRKAVQWVEEQATTSPGAPGGWAPGPRPG